MDIHLIGPYPPPHGGVSVHIQRLKHCLVTDGHSCTVWQLGRHKSDKRHATFLDNFKHLYMLPYDSILHFHENHLLAGLLAAANKKVVFTVHNERISQLVTGGETLKRKTIRSLTRYFFKKVPVVIAVSETSKEELERVGCDGKHISIINAYIPPFDDESVNIRDFEDFNDFKTKHDFLITANASALSFHSGANLYGIDLCLEMLERLKDEYPTVGFVLALSLGRSNEGLDALMKDVAERGLTDRILILNMSGAYHPILRNCDLFLRPTNTDGFSLSIAEALEFGIPVIASDATKRPSGCLLFRNRDIDDLVNKVVYVIHNYDTISAVSFKDKVDSSYGYVVELYRRACLNQPFKPGQRG